MSYNIVKVNSEEELINLTAELINVLINMRFTQRYWNENFGHAAKARKQYWEAKADELLTRLGFDEHNRLKTIKIERQA